MPKKVLLYFDFRCVFCINFWRLRVGGFCISGIGKMFDKSSVKKWPSASSKDFQSSDRSSSALSFTSKDLLGVFFFFKKSHYFTPQKQLKLVDVALQLWIPCHLDFETTYILIVQERFVYVYPSKVCILVVQRIIACIAYLHFWKSGNILFKRTKRFFCIAAFL